MEIPEYQRCYLETPGQLADEIARLQARVPLAADISVLNSPLPVAGKQAPNRWCAQPLTCGDATPNGRPSELTLRRYRRLAAGGFGMIWAEAAAPDLAARSTPTQLALTDNTVEAFAAWTQAMRAAAREHGHHRPLLVLQLDHAPLAAAAGTPDLEAVGESMVQAALRAQEAGFDAVDVACGQDHFFGRILRAGSHPASRSATLDDRCRLLCGILETIHRRAPELLRAVRLNVYNASARPAGFGVDKEDYRRSNLEEPLRVVTQLRGAGMDLLNVTCCHTNLRDDASRRKFKPLADGEIPHEHPLTALTRLLESAARLRARHEGLVVVAGGFSYLRHLLPQAASGAVAGGMVDAAGVGRAALAYPGFPAELERRGTMAYGNCCMLCQACLYLLRGGRPAGCVLRDSAVYGPEYRHLRRTSDERLMEEAVRCHDCEAAPCSAATPGGVDIPAFIRAYREGRNDLAYRILRRGLLLPELCAHVAPAWRQGEGACIEIALSGRPVAIRDLQYRVSLQARTDGKTGIALPDRTSGRRFAVIGGGPTGLAGAATLLEKGHRVTLLEAADVLGGVPSRLIPADRLADPRPEIKALLEPALAAGRLDIRYGTILGPGSMLDEILANHTAVLLAMGLWQETTLGRRPGVIDALSFLETARRKDHAPRAARAAVLAGGDCATDAAYVLHAAGCTQLYVVFPGPRSAMLWCMEEAFFSRPGVHALTLMQPLGYVDGAGGRCRGVRLRRTRPLGHDRWRRTRETETVLPVDLVVEAMGLRSTGGLAAGLPGVRFTRRGLVRTRGTDTYQTHRARAMVAGALRNGGASVPECIVEGLAAAKEMHALWSG